MWNRFIDEIFSQWDISMKESYNFVDFANSFHPTVGFIVKLNLATIKKINKAGKSKLEGNLHMISLTDS